MKQVNFSFQFCGKQTFCFIIFILVTEEKLVRRGCVSELLAAEQNHCYENSTECKLCNRERCNSRLDFLSCTRCDSSKNRDCILSPNEHAFEYVCKHYEDECFTRVVKNRVTRGCLIESTETDTNLEMECSNRRLCKLCTNGNRCNSEPVEHAYCYWCNSIVDERCKSNVSHSMRIQCPLSGRHLGCYHIEMPKEGRIVVARGCYTNVDETFCNENPNLCKNCLENECNHLSSFQRCIQCVSNSSGDCHQLTDKTPTKICPNYNDQCLTKISDDNVIERGCIDQYYVCKDSSNCATCSNGSLCNNFTLTQDYCIKCHSRNDSKCHQKVDYIPKKCRLSLQSQGCFHSFRSFPATTIRGCMIDLSIDDRKSCRSGISSCLWCMGSGCNIRNTFPMCYSCSSETDEKCVHSLPITIMETCRHYNDECFTYVSGGVIERGCLKSRNKIFINNCRSETQNCAICNSTVLCNNHRVATKQCIHCDSRNDTNCIDLPKKMREKFQFDCRFALFEQGCYTNEKTGIGGVSYVERGCVANIEDQREKLDCIEEKNSCRVCSDSNCNYQPKHQECYICDDCVVPKLYHFKNCETSFDSCAIQINKTGHTNRGCSSLFPIRKFKEICFDRACNNFPYPKFRIKCLHCDGESACQYINQTIYKKKLKFCNIFEFGESCYSLLGEGNFWQPQ